MKTKLRRILVKLLIFVSVIGNVIYAVKIQNLESELQKERNPSFEQVKKELFTKIRFKDWTFYESGPKIEYWVTWEEACEHSYKVCSNEALEVTTDLRESGNLYMGVWEVKNRSQIKASLSMLAGDCFELDASLPGPGEYIVGLNYRGINLFFAFELEMKK